MQAEATKAKKAPSIDGVFDDPAWANAKWNDHFTQRVPQDGADPTYRTEFAVVYDEKAIYIAVKNEIPSRDKVISRLTRRDRGGDYDCVRVTLAPRQDGKTGYSFAVNPDGVKLDSVFVDRWSDDPSWDAVWEAATRIEDKQWTAEFAIPLDQVRIPANQKKWEFQVDRWISDLQEHVTFNPVPSEASGWVSSAGELKNVENIVPQNPYTVTPEAYVSYRDVTENFGGRGEPGFDWGLGGYAKLGLLPDLLLDLTVLPDFGQVEVDKVVVNLSAFETQFPEKRPFFLEGADMFNTPIQLFYSRRLGAPPPEPSHLENESISSGPVGTPILSAIKLTGRTPGGSSAGLLEGVLMRTEFKVKNDDEGETEMRESTPWTNATVLRVNQELGTSSVGAMGTALNPWGTDGSYTGGVDWVLRTDDTNYAFRGQVAGSTRYSGVLGKDEAQGLAAHARVGREGGDHYRWFAQYRFFSDEFDSNDMGFLTRNDLHHYALHVQLFRQTPVGPFSEIYTGVIPSGQLNTDGLDLGHTGEVYFNTKWKNNWWSNVGFQVVRHRFDDRESRGGPDLKMPSEYAYWVWVSTSENKMLSAFFGVSQRFWSYGHGTLAQIGPALRLGRFELNPSISYRRFEDQTAYVDTVSGDDGDQTIIGRRNMDELNFSLDGTVVILRDLTFQFNSQLVAVRTHYKAFEHLRADSSTVPYLYESEPDFSRADLIIQGLMRWEYLPGCAVYAVYTHFGFAQGDPINNPTLNRGFKRLKDEEREHLFMLKLSHRFG